MQIFNFINVLVDRLGDEIKPLAPGLLQLIPGLWTTSEGQSLLRIQVALCNPFHAQQSFLNEGVTAASEASRTSLLACCFAKQHDDLLSQGG